MFSIRWEIKRVLLRMREHVIGGGRWRERLLIGLLRQNYQSRRLLDWNLARNWPHFFEQRLTLFQLGWGKECVGPYSLNRAFFASEVICDGDLVLDIGCGDGFITRSFVAPRAARADAIDIEPSAIRSARRRNSAANIRFFVRNAIEEPFPASEYDVIVWDGAIGHFSATDADRVLRKIRIALRPGGLFIGSESLGREGHDHFQFFDELDDIRGTLSRHFPIVELREETYSLGSGEKPRREVYWRCSADNRRLTRLHWRENPPAIQQFSERTADEC